MLDLAEPVLLALAVAVAAVYFLPGLVAGLLWALLPTVGALLPVGSGLIVYTLGMAVIAVRCSASRDPGWLQRSTGLLVALAAGMLVTVRKILDDGPLEAGILTMPLAIVISLLLLYIGLSTVGRVGLLRGVVLGVTFVSGGEVLRVAGGGAIHPEAAAFGLNPITIGQFSTLGVLLAIFLMRLGISRLLHVVTTLICAAGLAATNSRGPLLALGVALLTMYIQQVRNPEKKKRDFRLRPLIPLVAIMTTILVFNTVAGQFSEWFRTGDEDNNAGGRLDAWSKAAESIFDAPILGQGAGRYNMGELGATSGLPTFPHNIFLEIWSEYGLIPFVLLIAAMVVVVRRSGAAGRPTALGFVVCFSISGSLDTSLGLWVALAIALTLTPTGEYLSRKRSSPQTTTLVGAAVDARTQDEARTR